MHTSALCGSPAWRLHGGVNGDPLQQGFASGCGVWELQPGPALRLAICTSAGVSTTGLAQLSSVFSTTSAFLPGAPHEQHEKAKDRTLKDELPRSMGAQYATGEEQRNNSRKNEETEPQWKQHPVVDVTGDGSKVWCCKEQYRIRTWNVRSMNQGKSEVVKQEMARVNQYFRKSVN